jgi:hypothetical protein
MGKPKEIQQGAYGFIINFVTSHNMETTDSLKFRIRKKGASEVVEHSVPIANIIDVETGSVNVVIEEGDFDTLGPTKLQIVDDTTGRYLPSTPVSVIVMKNI